MLKLITVWRGNRVSPHGQDEAILIDSNKNLTILQFVEADHVWQEVMSCDSLCESLHV